MSFTEKRNDARKSAQWPGRLITPDKQQVRIKSRNISVSGAQLTVPVVLKEGDEVLVELNMMYRNIKQNIRAKCVVNYVMISGSNKHQVGVVFTTISEEDIEIIALYCRTKKEITGFDPSGMG